MLKNQPNMIPDDFEALLLQTIASGYKTDKEIQKAVDMNANYVYSMPVAIAIEQKADENIAKIIKSGSGSGKFIFRLILLLSVAGLITILSYNYLSRQQVPANPQNTNAIIPLSAKDRKVNDSFQEEKPEPIIYKTQFFHNENSDSSENISDTIKDIAPISIINSGNPVPKTKSDYGYNDRFDYNYAESLHPDKDNPVKLYPGEYSIDGYVCRLTRWTSFTNNYVSISNNLTRKQSNEHDTVLLPLYNGIPFKKGFENMTFIPVSYALLQLKTFYQEKPQNIYLLEGMKYYYDETKYNNHYADFLKDKDNYKYLEPFYISNTEISNIEYKEFINWVAEYNGFSNLDPLYIGIDSVNPQAFIYTFHQTNPEIMKRFGKNSINIFPKTDCWTGSFPTSYNKPMDDYYFIHPAYNNYPVVGVSYWQALAYLDWLTWIWQTRADNQNIPYTLEFDLPTDYQWELAAHKILENVAIIYMIDNNLCNLFVKSTDDYDYRSAIGIFAGYNPNDAFLTFPVTDVQPTTPVNPCQIKNMDANVSEWLKESYSQGWSDYIEAVRNKLRKQNKPSDMIYLQTEEYFDQTCNDKNGKLVRGANWADRRPVDRSHDVSQSLFVKAFINPDDQHCTLGFRYVMKVRLKDEDKIVKKIEILGRNMPEIDYSLLKVKYTKNYAPDPEGFSFIPSGSFVYKDTTTTVPGLWAQKTEVCNLTWMIFLNYLIENKRYEDLSKCIPDDPEWKIKMNMETDTVLVNNKFDKSDLYKFLPFTKKFMTDNKIEAIPVTYFAFRPVVGISHEAARIFADWLTEMTKASGNIIVDFRLPTEAEWEYMAQAGIQNAPYAWGGPFTRNYKGQFLAKYYTSSYLYKNTTIDSVTYQRVDEDKLNEIIKSQNQEFTGETRDSNWNGVNSTLPVGYFPPNDWGLYDMCGNVAEMITAPDKTKGGSWASMEYFIQIRNEEKWSGKPSDCVGFRLVQTYIGSGKEN